MGFPTFSGHIICKVLYDVKLVTDVMDKAVIKRHISYAKTKDVRTRKQHLCLDKTYNSKTEEQEIVNRKYVLHLPIREKEAR